MAESDAEKCNRLDNGLQRLDELRCLLDGLMGLLIESPKEVDPSKWRFPEGQFRRAVKRAIEKHNREHPGEEQITGECFASRRIEREIRERPAYRRWDERKRFYDLTMGLWWHGAEEIESKGKGHPESVVYKRIRAQGVLSLQELTARVEKVMERCQLEMIGSFAEEPRWRDSANLMPRGGCVGEKHEHYLTTRRAMAAYREAKKGERKPYIEFAEGADADAMPAVVLPRKYAEEWGRLKATVKPAADQGTEAAAKTPKAKLTEPTREQLAAYYRYKRGNIQKDIAAELERAMGGLCSQSKVCRWIGKVEKWVAAGGHLAEEPDLRVKDHRRGTQPVVETNVAPDWLESAQARNPLTNRQRGRREK